MAEDARNTAQKIVDLSIEEANAKKAIAEQVKKVQNATESTKQTEIEKLAVLRQQKDVLSDALKLEKKIVDTKIEYSQELDREDLLTYDILKNKHKIKDFEKELNKLKQKGMDVEDDIYKMLLQRKEETETIYKMNSKAAGAAQMQNKIGEKTAEIFGVSAGFMRGISSTAITLGKSLLTVKGAAVALVGGALVGMGLIFKDILSNAKELQQTLRGSFRQMARLRTETVGIDKVMKFLGYDTNAAFTAIQENLGGVGAITDKMAMDLLSMQITMGVTTSDSAKLIKNLMVSQNLSFKQAKDFLTAQGALAEVNGIAIGKMMEDVANETGLFADFSADGSQALFRASIQARKLGLSLGTVSKLAEKFMDFPSAIEDSFNLSTLLGVDLGKEFMGASMASIQGDLPKLMQTITSMLSRPDLFSRADAMGIGGLARKQFRDTFGFDPNEAIRLLKAGDQAGYESLFSKDKLDAAAQAQIQLQEQMDITSNSILTLNKTVSDLYNWLNKQTGGAMQDPTKVLTDPKGVFGNLLPLLGIGSSAFVIPSIFRGIKGLGTKLFGGGGGGPKTPNMGDVYQTKTGRFKLPGMKGPGFKSMSGLTQKLAGTTLKSAGKYAPLGIGTALRLGGIGAYAGRGDYTGAGIETLSALASFIPKFGTVAALALDAYNLNRHMNLDDKVEETTTTTHADNQKILEKQDEQINELRNLVIENKLTRTAINNLVMGD